ncbi:polysaccharide lyase 8 family protein [Agromyces sp. PvR057]|uniref:polysaccharide lyase 8 family protein n=1 Tax=Agromyces sp. PvR057 TaxID=3156403 RepID=UPI0033964BA5
MMLRRSFLAAAAASAGLALIGAEPAHAKAGRALLGPLRAATAADVAALRSRWIALTVGEGLDLADAGTATRLATLGADAETWLASMSGTSASLWPDLVVTGASANVTATANRLLTIARAVASPGTGLTGDAAATASVAAGIGHTAANLYTASTPEYGNWWDWRIGTAQSLQSAAILVHGALPAATRAAVVAAADHFLPDTVFAGSLATGANLADICLGRALSGAIADDGGRLASARDRLSPVFPLVTSGDGLHADGSFIQHTVIPYTGTYGAVLLGSTSRLIALLTGTEWAVVDPQRQVLFDAVERAFAPFMHDGIVMDTVSGRGVSRGLGADGVSFESDHTRGHSIAASVVALAGAASTAERARWRALAKGWIQRDSTLPLAADTSLGVAAYARLRALLADPAVAQADEGTGIRVFGAMDRVVVRTTTFAASIAMCSKRTSYYEHGNGENLRGWHGSNGMVSWWGVGGAHGAQYSDHYWPTVDPYRLPGTTVSLKPLADGAGPAWGGSMPTTSWAGGASDGRVAAVGMTLTGLQSTLGGKKSWFVVDDAILCLGANISSTDGAGVTSVIDNRAVGQGGANALVVDGVARVATAGSSYTAAGPAWAHLEGHGGYVFLAPGQQVGVQRTDRAGAWKTINTGGSTVSATRRYVSLYLAHGQDPSGAAYAYAMLPAASSATTQARATGAWASVLQNDRFAQAVSVPSAGATLVNFWEVPTAPIAGLSVTKPASVTVRVDGTTATIALADPKQAETTIDLVWSRAGSVAALGVGVVKLGDGADIRLRFTVGGRAGASLTATVNLA